MTENTDPIETTTEALVLSPAVSLPIAGALAVVGGAVGAMFAGSLSFSEAAADSTKLVPFALALAGIFAGAGIGLLLADMRVSKTEKKATTLNLLGGPQGAIATKSIEALKDLSAGKVLLVLAVVLILIAMWTVNPGVPDTTVNVGGGV
jgi:Na+/glutamate symporter